MTLGIFLVFLVYKISLADLSFFWYELSPADLSFLVLNIGYCFWYFLVAFFRFLVKLMRIWVLYLSEYDILYYWVFVAMIFEDWYCLNF